MTCTGLAEITSLKNLSKAEENVKECCRPLRVETSLEIEPVLRDDQIFNQH